MKQTLVEATFATNLSRSLIPPYLLPLLVAAQLANMKKEVDIPYISHISPILYFNFLSQPMEWSRKEGQYVDMYGMLGGCPLK